MGGKAVTLTLSLTTAVAQYPDVVGLYPGELPAGLHAAFASRIITPTQSGATTTLLLSAADTAPGAGYSVPIQASGGGISRTLVIDVKVLEPGFGLAVVPNAPELGEGESVAVVIDTSAVNGLNDPIDLSLEGAPPGLLYSFSKTAVTPGASATLVLSDTELLADGQYELVVTGAAGLRTKTATVTLAVNKPDFTLDTPELSQWVQPGGVIRFPISLSGLKWTQPVTLSLGDNAELAPAVVGLALTPDGTPTATVQVTAPAQVYLIVATTADTPQARYELQVNGSSAGKERTLAVTVAVGVGQPICYMPKFLRSHRLN